MARNKRTDASNARTREVLAADVEEFLKSGKEIEKVPMGVSGQGPAPAGRKQLVLKPRRV
jgi:hypothetical protein